MQSKTLEYEIKSVVQNAIDDGRDRLNDDEAQHLIKLSGKLVEEYIKKLEEPTN